MRHLVLSLTAKDFRVDHLRVGGHGGQHRDKTSAGARVTHPASGAVGEATESRSQATNRAVAFRRMYASPLFQAWMRLETHPEELLVEVFRDGEWVAIDRIEKS